jgi:bifunctional DNA-binding transcriptional regulator/antitoxin component of YhaV-PrlF toxin-antitoxin module
MINLTVGQEGEIRLPDDLRERHGIAPETPLRVIETRSGIYLIPLNGKDVSAALTVEMENWQSLGQSTWDSFSYENEQE